MKKNARRKYIQLVADRTTHLKAAEAALAAGNQAEYDRELQAATDMNAEIEQLQALVSEQDRFIGGISVDPAQSSAQSAIPEDVENLVDTLRAGNSIQLPQNEVLAAVRSAMNAVLTGTETLTKPVGTGTDIHDNRDTVSGVLDMVTTMDLSGLSEWQEPYVKTSSTAGIGEDGKAPSESEPVFRVAAVTPVLVDTLAYVSRHIANLTPAAYYEKVKSLSLAALRRKVVDLMTKGDGKNFYGFLNAKNTKGEDICATYSVTSNMIDEKFLRKLVLGSGGDETTGSGILQLHKQDLVAFGDVRGTSDKKPVYEITPDAATNGNTGTIKDGGLTVRYVINSKMTPLTTAVQGAEAIKTMVYGDLAKYILGVFGPFSVTVDGSYKFAEKLWTVLGEVMVGGNLCAHEALTVVTLGAKAGE